jgi:hypothetical protein
VETSEDRSLWSRLGYGAPTVKEGMLYFANVIPSVTGLCEDFGRSLPVVAARLSWRDLDVFWAPSERPLLYSRGSVRRYDGLDFTGRPLGLL